MPIYEYLCKTCSHRFEQWQRMTDEPLVTCPECGSHIRRVYYPAGIVFKGSGFYKTDSHASPVASSDNHTKKSEDGTAAATSESKRAGESKSSSSTKSSSDSAGTATSENKVAAPTK